jgi:DHA1 family inner membrane transport protein
VVYAVALLITAWAPSVWFLVPARALMGLGAGTGGVMVAVQALLVPRRNLGMAIALVQSAMPIAQSLGPPLGALAIPFIGLRGLFIVDASAMVACAIATFVLMPEPDVAAKPGSVLGRTAEVLRTAWDMEPVRWNFICAFAQRGATGIVDAYLPVRITQIAADPAPAIGWILGIYGTLTTIATWLVGRILERSNEPTIYTRAVFFATLITAGMAAVSNLWLLGLLAALRSVPVAFSNTVLHSHNAKIIPRAHQTAVLSLSPVPRNLGGLVFPLLAAMTASLGPGIPLALGAVSYAFATLAGVRLRRVSAGATRPPRPDPPELRAA